MEQEEAQYDTISGTSEAYGLSVGAILSMTEEDVSGEAGSFLITAIQHTATDAEFTASDTEASYENSFQCIPSDTKYRTARTTPKPFIAGVQTAVVVGPSGEEIYTDKYARVKVQFFWDRKGQKDENSSCWIRVAEHWAGKNWGMIANPRIGQEVVVDFLE